MKLNLLILLGLPTLVIGCTKPYPNIPDLKTGIDRKNANTWFASIYPSYDELKWRFEIELNAYKTFRKSHTSKKPIALWLEKGHPLGATSSHGRAMRQTLLDPDLAFKLNKFVRGADDINRVAAFKDFSEGIYFFTTNGIVLGESQSLEPSKIVNAAEVAYAKWSTLEKEDKHALDPRFLERTNRLEDEFPKYGLAMEIFSRKIKSFGLEQLKKENWHKDFIWFTQSEMKDFVTPIKIMSKNEVSTKSLLKIINYGLRGEKKFTAEDIGDSHLTFKCTSIIKEKSSYIVEGQIHAPYFEADIFGFGSYDSEREQFRELELTFLSEKYDKNGFPEKRATVMRKVTPYDDWHRIPPKDYHEYRKDYLAEMGSGSPNK